MKPIDTSDFERLRPLCIALSQVSLSRPNDTFPHLRQLLHELQCIDSHAISQGLGNYIFFPLKPLLGPNVNETVLTETFHIIEWLLPSSWFEHGSQMTVQLLILHTTFLAKAKSEELKDSLIRSCRTLFKVAKHSINDLAGRPTLAHTTMLLMNDTYRLDTQILSLEALTLLYKCLEGDAAASFLPGTVSSLSKVLLKVNQRSRVLAAGLQCLVSSIVKSFIGLPTEYRSEKWASATASQIVLALTPVLSRLLSVEQDIVVNAAADLCLRILSVKTIPSKIFIEFLLQIRPQAIPREHVSEVAMIVETYIDAAPRIFQGVDEQRKINMLNTLSSAFPLLGSTAAQILSAQFISCVHGFLKFRSQSDSTVLIVPEADEAPREPIVEYLSNEARDALAITLGECIPSSPMEIKSSETLWIAQKTNTPTYQYAVEHLATQTDLALQSIIQQARAKQYDFRTELIHVLYPLLSYPQPSLYTLNEISTACGYNSIEEMIVENADYIINSLSLAFVTLEITPQTPKILGLLVQLAPRMVELIDDVVATFFDFLDDYHAYPAVVEGIFSGLSGVVKAVANQEPESHFERLIDRPKAETDQNQSSESLEEAFEEVEDMETTNSARKIEEDENPDAKLSKSYKIVVSIFEKSQLFLSHESDVMKIRILQLIYDGIPVVATNEDKFLPLVHLYWPQLTRRMQDQNPYVVAGVLRVIARTITFAGSFMRMRIKDDVLPFVQDVIQPARDKRGNLVNARKDWEGTGRRKVAEGIQDVLKASIEDGGLVRGERRDVLSLIERLASKSAILAKVLEQAREMDSF